MPAFRQGDVLRVPFPYVERPVVQHRPAVVVSAGDISGVAPLLWVAMITSAENRSWLGDIPLTEMHDRFGLPQPCVIRPAKIATIEARGVDLIGHLDDPIVETLLQAILARLGASAQA